MDASGHPACAAGIQLIQSIPPVPTGMGMGIVQDVPYVSNGARAVRHRMAVHQCRRAMRKVLSIIGGLVIAMLPGGLYFLAGHREDR